MDSFRELLARVVAFVRRRTRDEDFERELSSHLDLAIEDNLRRGLSAEESRREALIRLGGIQQTRELHRSARALPIVDSFLQDVRHACRTLWREPTFALAVVVTLSLGIGASTAVFGMLSTTLASRLPYRDADRLVIGGSMRTGEATPGIEFVSGLDYFDYRESNRSFEDLAAFFPFSNPAVVTGSGEPWEVDTGGVTWNLLRTLRVDPALGRHFRPEEEAQANAGVVMITFGLWQRRFGGARDVIGRTIVLDGAPTTIVGVLPRGFRFVGAGDGPGRPTNAEVWLVISRPGQARHLHNYHLVGRLRPGVSLAQAQRDADAISRTLERAYPDSNKGKGLRLITLHQYLGGSVRAGLLTPAAATACLLLIACANVAGLLLARGQRHVAEMAVRSALGASRRRLVRQQLVGSVVLTLPASLLGIAVACLLQGLLLHLLPLGALNVTQPVVDGLVLLFVLGASVVTGLLVGIVPALRGATADLLCHLGTGRQAGERSHGNRLRGALVVAQIAASVVLLVGAGLVARSLIRLSGVDLGFSADRVLTARIEIQAPSYPDRARRQAFFTAVLGDISALPGVRRAGATTHLPILDPGNMWRTWSDERALGAGYDGEHTHLRRVSPGYFTAMKMPLVRGRDIADTDRDGAPAVAVLSESLARRLYPQRDPIGRAVMLHDSLSRPARDIAYRIVGIVRSARLSDPREEGDPALYLSMLQTSPTYRGMWQGQYLRLVVRTDGDPTSVIAPLRAVVGRYDRNALVADVQTMEQVVDGAFTGFRRMVRYLALFAAVAVGLAAIGLYGALAYHVGQQEHEIGVRQALGATRASILGLVLRRGGWLVVTGLLLGLSTAYPGTKLVRSLLFETAPLDPTSYAGAALALAVVAAAACVVPALRAMRVDPAVVLRSE